MATVGPLNVDKTPALNSRSIPYYPALRKHSVVLPNGKVLEKGFFKSREACLWFQQLCYRLERHPNGFYKFTEPSPNNPAYRAGDSWCEELGLSKKEFLYMRPEVVTHYPSKDKWSKACKENNQFKGLPFCSYINKQTRITYYFANLQVINEIRKTIDQQPFMQVTKRNLQEVTKGNVHKYQKGTYVSDKKELGLYQENTHKMNTKMNNNITELTSNSVSSGVNPKIDSEVSFGTTNEVSDVPVQAKGNKPKIEERVNENLGKSINCGVLQDLNENSKVSDSKETKLLRRVSNKDNTGDKEVAEVFEHWQQTLNHQKSKLDSKRCNVIKKALKLGYSLEDLKLAIDGCAKSDWHMGKNDRGRRYDDIELIFRDAKHVEQFMEYATAVTSDTSSLQTGIVPAQERRYETFKERDARLRNELRIKSKQSMEESRLKALKELGITGNEKQITTAETLTPEI